MLQPRVECVVHHEAVFQLFVIITEVVRQTERDRQQSRALRSEIEPVCIGTSHDDRQIEQCRIGEVVLLEDRVEAALWAIVSQFDSCDIIGNGPSHSRLGVNLIRWNEHELR